MQKSLPPLIIPAAILADSNLHPTAKLLYGLINTLQMSKGIAWPSNAYLARTLGISDRYVRTMLRELVDAGHIQRGTVDDSHMRSLITCGQPLTDSPRGRNRSSGGRNHSSGEGGTIVPGGAEQEFHQNKTRVIKQEEPSSTTTASHLDVAAKLPLRDDDRDTWGETINRMVAQYEGEPDQFLLHIWPDVKRIPTGWPARWIERAGWPMFVAACVMSTTAKSPIAYATRILRKPDEQKALKQPSTPEPGSRAYFLRKYGMFVPGWGEDRYA